MSDETPFSHLGAPPGDEDPRAQIQYMIGVLQAFEDVREPRMKPLRDKLHSAIAELEHDDDGKVRERYAASVQALQIETYDLIVVVVSQVRATLRAQLARGMSKPDRLDTERLQRDLGDFSQAMRKLVAAIKKGDHAKRLEAERLLEAAGGGIKAIEEQID